MKWQDYQDKHHKEMVIGVQALIRVAYNGNWLDKIVKAGIAARG